MSILHIYKLSYTKQKLGMKKFVSALKSFDIEFQPFVNEIKEKERIIREYADAATMERIRSMMLDIIIGRQNLMQAYRYWKRLSKHYAQDCMARSHT